MSQLPTAPRAATGARVDLSDNATIPDLAQAAIRIRGLTHTFGGLRVLDRIDLDVAPKEFVAIVGPSGCGKTTLLNILGALLPVQSGEVTIAGAAPKPGNRDIAFMFANDALLPWRTTLRNALFGVEVRGEASSEVKAHAHEMLERIGLGAFEQAYPRQLSRGMRQRAALARTFLMNSSYLLMDEPFGALDAQTRLTLQRLLLDLWEANRRTVVFITHDLTEAVLLADRVIVFGARPGRLLASVPINLERPRDPVALQRDDAFHDTFAGIWRVLEEEMTS